MQKIQILSSLCAKVRLPRSSCRRCLSVCPVNAIRFNDQSIEVTSDCVNCQFCVAICPNGVFSTAEKPNWRVQDFSHLERIFCSRLLSDEKPVLGPFPTGIVPCLGSIPAHFLLTWISTSNKPLKIVTMDCSRCEMHAGISLFQDAASQVGTILREINPDIEPVIVQEATKKDRLEACELYRQFQNRLDGGNKFSRRDFFVSLQKRLFLREDAEASERNHGRNSFSEERLPERLRAVISFYRENQGHLLEGHNSPLFSEIDIANSCTGCGACARVCPTGALSLKKVGKKVYLNWTPSHCTQCDLCKEVCSKDSVRFFAGLDISRILDESTTAVKIFYVNVCPECNRENLSYEITTDCPYCQKERDLIEEFSKIIYGEQY